MTDNIQQSSSDEISLKDLILKIKKWFAYLKTQWWKIAIAGIIGGAIGFVYAWMQPITYTAKTTFVVEDAKSGGGLSGLASLAGQFGVDVGGGGGGGRGGKYGLDFMLHKQEMINNNIQRDRDRMFQAAMAQQDFQNRNQLALNQFDIQKQILDFSDAKEQAKEKRIADRQDRVFARDATRADKLRAEEIARRDFEFQADNQEFDRRRQVAADEFFNRQMHEQTVAARDNIGMRAKQLLEQGEIADPKLAAKIRDLITDRESVLLDPKWDAAQREQFLADYNSKLTALMSQVPVRSKVEKANDNIQYLNMQTGQYQGTFDPNVPMTVIDQKSGIKYQTPGAQSETETPEQYYRQNPDAYEKDFENERARIQDQIADGSMKGMTDADIDNAAWQRMQEKFNFKQRALSGQMQGEQGGQGQVPPEVYSGVMGDLGSDDEGKKKAAMDRMKDPNFMDALSRDADLGNPQAKELIRSMENTIPMEHRVAAMGVDLRSKDPNVVMQTMNEMDQLRKEGVIDDYDYAATFVRGIGKPAKEIFNQFVPEWQKKGMRDVLSGDMSAIAGAVSGEPKLRNAMPNTLNALGQDLGLLDSRAFVRAFQSTPKIEDVIKKVMESSKMSEAEAEEYVYKRALADNFTEALPSLLASGTGLVDNQKKKQAEQKKN